MKNSVAFVLVAILGVIMIAAVTQLPRPGSPDAPAQTHVSAFYVDGGKELGGAENLVTAVLLNFRALDTFGEVVVIFAALIAVLAVVTSQTVSRSDDGIGSRASRPVVPVSPLVGFMVRLLAPFIATFAIFVMLKGHVLPGGGFQGGAVLGALLILLALFSDRPPGSSKFASSSLFWIRATGVVAFALAGVAGLFLSGWLFGLPEESQVREAMMIVLELGIGIGGAAVLLGLYQALAQN